MPDETPAVVSDMVTLKFPDGTIVTQPASMPWDISFQSGGLGKISSPSGGLAGSIALVVIAGTLGFFAGMYVWEKRRGSRTVCVP